MIGNSDRGDNSNNDDSDEGFRGFSPPADKPETQKQKRKSRKRRSKNSNGDTISTSAPCEVTNDEEFDTASTNSNSDDEKMASGDSQIPAHLIFNGTDYVIWKKRMRTILSAKELEKTLNAENNMTEKDRRKAYSELVNHMNNSVFRLVREESDPAKLIKELDERYGKENEAIVIACRAKLAKIDIDNFRSAKEYCDEVSNLVNEIESAGVKISKAEEFSFLNTGLRNQEKWKIIRKSAEALLNVTTADPKILRGLLTSDDEKKSENSIPSTNKGTAYAATSSDNRSGDANSRQKPKLKCYKCHKLGHHGKNCRNPGNFRQNSSPRKTNEHHFFRTRI